MRISVSNWSTTEADIDRSADAMRAVMRQVPGDARPGVRSDPARRLGTSRPGPSATSIDRGDPLLLANCWDAGSARLIEASGALAMATTSAGLAWSHGYPDGDAIPLAVLTTAVAQIARVISVPLTVDIEGGFST